MYGLPPSSYAPAHTTFCAGKDCSRFSLQKWPGGSDIGQLGDIKKVQEQANYTNAILNTIAKQLNQLNAKTDYKKEAAKKEMARPTTKHSSSFADNFSKPFVKLDSIPRATVESLPMPKSPNFDLVQNISEQMKAIGKKKSLACIDKTAQQKVDNTSPSEEEEDAVTCSSDSNEVVAAIQMTLEDEEPIQNSYKEEPLAVNKIQNWRNAKTRNYYPRPTPPDTRHEEGGQLTGRSFDGRCIYGWNIDGKVEPEVPSTIEEMGVAVAAFKVNGYSNKNIATIIVIRFSAQLKNWWDNYLTFDQRLAILNHTTNELDEHGERVQDAFETLVHPKTLHFISNPQYFCHYRQQ